MGCNECLIRSGIRLIARYPESKLRSEYLGRTSRVLRMHSTLTIVHLRKRCSYRCWQRDVPVQSGSFLNWRRWLTMLEKTQERDMQVVWGSDISICRRNEQFVQLPQSQASRCSYEGSSERMLYAEQTTLGTFATACPPPQENRITTLIAKSVARDSDATTRTSEL